MGQQDTYRMIQRRTAHAGIKTRIGKPHVPRDRHHRLPQDKGLLEHAQTLANHSSPRTTRLYDRRTDDISLDEVEKIAI